MELCLLFSDEKDIARKRYYLKQILYIVTDSDDIDINSRGGNIDVRDLHVIETFMGREFEGVDGANPNVNVANILCEIYSNIENIYYNHLNLKLSFGGYSTTIYEYTDENGNNDLERSLIDCVIESMIDDEDAYSDVLLYDLGVYLKLYDTKNGTNEFAEYCNYYSEKSQSCANIVELTKNANLFIGSENSDKYIGTSIINLIFGEDSDDLLYGLDGDDYIYGGYGGDTLYGGRGNDNYYIELFHENDVIYDTDGNNNIIFSDYYRIDDYDISISVNGGFVFTNKYTDETISLPDFLTNPVNYDFVFNGESQTLGDGEPREVIEGTAEDDYLEAGDGFNVFYGGDGNDTFAGGANMDFMYGENGDDLLIGRNGVNVLFGGVGNDTIYDGDDGSYLNGGDDDDSLYGGGAGNDYLQGDHGGDTYIFGRIGIL